MKTQERERYSRMGESCADTTGILNNKSTNDNWVSAATGLQKRADVERNACATMRRDYTKLDQSISKNIKWRSQQVEGSLKQKIIATRCIRDSLAKQLGSLLSATELLKKSTDRGIRATTQLRLPLKGTHTRQKLRNSRNSREQYTEAIDENLSEESLLLSTGINNLQQLTSEAEILLQQLKTCESDLEADLRDKSNSLDVDNRCLRTSQRQLSDEVSVIISSNSNEVKRLIKGCSDFSERATTNGKLPLPPGVSLPSIWQNSSNELINSCGSVEINARQLAKSLNRTVDEIHAEHRSCRKKTFNSFKSKVKQASTLRAHITGRIELLNQELVSLSQQQEELKKSLECKKTPLTVLRDRVRVRKTKPSREHVYDPVEIAMNSELDELLRSVGVLNDKVASIESEMKNLKSKKKYLSIDLRDKNVSIKVDRNCLDLSDGATTPAISLNNTAYSFTSSADATQNHNYQLHILNSLKPTSPRISLIARRGNGKRQYQKGGGMTTLN